MLTKYRHLNEKKKSQAQLNIKNQKQKQTSKHLKNLQLNIKNKYTLLKIKPRIKK